MARIDALTKLYSNVKKAEEFHYDMLTAPPIYSIVTPTDVGDLYSIATSIKYSSKVELKQRMIKEIMERRGFRHFASGTNRVCYKFLEDQSFLAKVAFDRIGLSDNPAEFRNQYKIAPCCTKTFEVSPKGTIGFAERVQPIQNREEFISVSKDIFDLIYEKLIGKYVIEDIGTNYFMNYGFRLGWGPVLLDYPYIYDLDGDKLFCNMQNSITGEYCLEEIIYDDGVNKLYCPKCGRIYKAKELAKNVENELVIREGRHQKMKITILNNNNEVIGVKGTSDKSIKSKVEFDRKNEKKKSERFKVSVIYGDGNVETKEPEEKKHDEEPKVKSTLVENTVESNLEEKDENVENSNLKIPDFLQPHVHEHKEETSTVVTGRPSEFDENESEENDDTSMDDEVEKTESGEELTEEEIAEGYQIINGLKVMVDKVEIEKPGNSKKKQNERSKRFDPEFYK